MKRFSLLVTATKYHGTPPRYNELFEELHTALREEKGTGSAQK